MYFVDKKKFTVWAIGALIISIIVNFPHLVNIIYSTPPPIMKGPPPFIMGHRPIFPHFTETEFLSFQFIWYYVVSFILLCITGNQEKVGKDHTGRQEVVFMILKVIMVITIAFALEMTILRQLMNHFEFKFRPRFDAILFSRYLFMLVVSGLTGLLIKMIDKKNSVEIENERLRLENLQIQYNALTHQMNPHFFFNSLNSLQYLLLEGEQQKSIIYINELSTVFRYILQSSKKELVPLKEELDFLKAYQYLLNIRFEDKIRFEIDICPDMYEMQIPILTLQPLVENAINHNGCSSKTPLVIKIFIQHKNLVVENNLIPKLHKSNSSGIGLENLNQRFLLLTGSGINIEQTDVAFKITLPLKN